jgi:hypothetical protein
MSKVWMEEVNFILQEFRLGSRSCVYGYCKVSRACGRWKLDVGHWTPGVGLKVETRNYFWKAFPPRKFSRR